MDFFFATLAAGADFPMTELTNKNAAKSRKAEIFIITALITIQGLYVIFPLPDIWPFSNYSMFSKASPSTLASSFKFYGITSVICDAIVKHK